MHYITLNPEKLKKSREAHLGGNSSLTPALNTLRALAEQALTTPAFSVMKKNFIPPSGTKHDYMSLAPYWWPNPNTPDGFPYLPRDGEVNPQRQLYDKPQLTGLVRTIEYLGLAYAVFGETRYARKACTLLRIFFLDPATSMNPHMKYGQGIMGTCSGRPGGIIESSHLVWRYFLDAVGLVADSPCLSESDGAGLKSWFAAYRDWMLASDLGREEDKSRNNHGTAYDLQVIAFSLFAGDPDSARRILESVASKRIATQIEPDGSQPLELKRTKAMEYANTNLEYFFRICSLGVTLGEDLWRYKTPDGRGIRKAIDWLLPYWLKEKAFPYQQIIPYSIPRPYHLLIKAGEVFPDLQPALIKFKSLYPEQTAAALCNLY